MSTWFRSYGFAEIVDGLLIGPYPLDGDDVGMLEWMGVARVLNLVEDEEYGPGERATVEAAYATARIVEYRLKVTDFGNLPPHVLEVAVREVCSWLDEGVPTYLHCRAGRQRSAAVAAGVIAVRHGVDVDEALAYVQSRKPSADPLSHQRNDLRQWWQSRSPTAAE